MPQVNHSSAVSRTTGRAARAQTNAVTRLELACLKAMKSIERNGRKGTPPPMVARNMFYVSAAIADVYSKHGDDPAVAAKVAKSVTAQVLNALVGQQVMPDDRLGADIARKHIAAARADGAVDATKPRPASKPMRHVWTPTNEKGEPITPLFPSWGLLKPSVEANATVRAKRPSFTDNDWRAFFTAYQTRTPEQIAAAKYWADGPGTFTPPGHWCLISQQVGSAAGLSVQQAAALSKLVNAALHDAGVSCWDTKYTYMGERPFQAARRLGIDFKPEIGTPPFPGFTSGHATFSGAAGQVLGMYFDKLGKADVVRKELLGFAQLSETRKAIGAARTATDMFAALANEAAMSRVYGGIHIAEDGDEGVRVGRQIGTNVMKHLATRADLFPTEANELERRRTGPVALDTPRGTHPTSRRNDASTTVDWS
ncbi:MAG: vanadium-dependent haloperoxidase [Myxococcaceae bacterium]|jgi:hypothetical protein|nr:vanadium-dependent haloperoxidase [Myxococcaceae bacterium]